MTTNLAHNNLTHSDVMARAATADFPYWTGLGLILLTLLVTSGVVYLLLS